MKWPFYAHRASAFALRATADKSAATWNRATPPR